MLRNAHFSVGITFYKGSIRLVMLPEDEDFPEQVSSRAIE